MSPRWLAVFGTVLMTMPIVSLVRGSYREVSIPVWLAAALALVSPMAVYGLFHLVGRRRESATLGGSPSDPPETARRG